MAKRRLRVGVLDVESGHLHGHWLEEQLSSRWDDVSIAVKAIGPKPRRRARNRRGGQVLLREFYSEPTYKALLRGEVDVGVHRMKDLPVPLPEGVELAAVTERKTPLDVLVTADGSILDDLPEGSTLGVSSLRRQAMMLRYRPDLAIEFVVGTLSERIAMVDAGRLSGVVVAASGIEWRGWQDRVAEVFTVQMCVPAVGQAALGLLVREGDEETAGKIRFLDHSLSRREILCERSFLEAVGASEGSAVGALARMKGDILRIEGCVCSLDGSKVLRDWAEGFPEDPIRTGQRLAQKLLDQGARDLLSQAAADLAPGEGGN